MILWLLLLIGILLSSNVVAEPYQFNQFDGMDAAKGSHSQVNDYMKTDTDINQNLVQPLLSSDSMSTFDGNQFSAQIACPASVSFLEVFAVPGATGDITTLSVEQDLDVDGHVDRVYNIPEPISGVCANGVVSCTPGTWDNCQAYRWQAQDSGELSLQSRPLSDLGGCYCINSHCGNGLVMNNLNRVLSDISGGAAAEMARINPLYAISNVSISGPIIQYYGQDAGDCGFAGDSNHTQYFNDPQSLKTAASLVLNSGNNPTSSSTDGSSVHQLIKTSAAASAASNELFSCTVDRQISVDEAHLNDIIAYNGGSGGVTTCGPGCLQLVIGTIGDDYWCETCAVKENSVQFWINQPERILSATFEHAVFDDWMQVMLNNQLIWNGPFGNWLDTSSAPTGACELSTSWDQRPNIDFTNQLKALTGNVTFGFRVAVSGCGEGYAFAKIMVDQTCGLKPDLINDQCVSYENNSECQLLEETVDGVQTYTNFISTGLSPLASQRTINGNICSFEQTRNWWQKERTYLCPTQSSYDNEKTIQRAATIQASATESGYDDYALQEDGTWEISSGHQLPNLTLPSVATCTPTCKTRRPRVANNVGGLGPELDVRNSSTSYDFLYHECDSQNLCPIGPGEELLKSCQCLNEFSEATAIMQSARMAGRDMICTSGQPVSLQ